MTIFIYVGMAAKQSPSCDIPASGDPFNISTKSTNPVSSDYFKGDHKNIMVCGYALPTGTSKMLANPKTARATEQ
ncbi:MAG: hypothetical protein AB1546_14350 [bacterium]